MTATNANSFNLDSSSNALPTGFSLSSSGVLSYIPKDATAGTYAIVIDATNTTTGATTTQNFTIDVVSYTAVINQGTLGIVKAQESGNTVTITTAGNSNY